MLMFCERWLLTVYEGMRNVYLKVGAELVVLGRWREQRSLDLARGEERSLLRRLMLLLRGLPDLDTFRRPDL